MRPMMRSPRFASLAAGMAAVMALSACSDGGGSSAAGDADTVTVRGCTPSFPMTPAATNSTCGLNVLKAVTARLVHYADNGEARTDLALSLIHISEPTRPY